MNENAFSLGVDGISSSFSYFLINMNWKHAKQRFVNRQPWLYSPIQPDQPSKQYKKKKEIKKIEVEVVFIQDALTRKKTRITSESKFLYYISTHHFFHLPVLWLTFDFSHASRCNTTLSVKRTLDLWSNFW